MVEDIIEDTSSEGLSLMSSELDGTSPGDALLLRELLR